MLTDNGKVFTARFSEGPGPVLFDKVCDVNGITHILTAPYSPTTTGKVERFHKTWRKEFVTDHDYVHATMVEAQQTLDAWVEHDNTVRPHQSLAAWRRWNGSSWPRPRLEPAPAASHEPEQPSEAGPPPAGVTGWVDQRGGISLARHRYRVGAHVAGELVEVVVTGGLVHICHHGVVVATHVQKGRATMERPPPSKTRGPRARRPAAGPSITRIADGNGSISYAGTMYRAGSMWARQPTTRSISALRRAHGVPCQPVIMRSGTERHLVGRSRPRISARDA